LNDDSVPDTQLFAQRGTVLPVRADLTPEQREALKEGSNRAFAGESLVQLDGTTTSVRAPAATVRAATTGGGGGRTVEILRGDKSERVRY
jgi:pilus assembly protein CpaB